MPEPMPGSTQGSAPEPIKATPVLTFDKKDIDDNKLIACLSYIGILCLVPLLAKKDSKFAHEHGKQGLVLMIVWIVGSFIFWFPLIGWALMFLMFIFNVVAFVKCLMGEFWEIPVIGAWRKKFNL